MRYVGQKILPFYDLIPSNFDGGSIYKHGENGQYSVKNLYIYHTGDPTVPDYVVDAHITGFYNFNEFDTIPGMQVERFETICKGDKINIGDTIFTESGHYTLNLTDADGCDSTVVLTLGVNPVFNENAKVNICQGETYTFGTQTLSETGEYTESFESVFVCDSTVVLNLNVSNVEKPTIIQHADTLTCNIVGEYAWFSNNEFLENVTTQTYVAESSGQFQVRVTNENGCQSLLSDAVYVIKTSVIDLEFVKNIIVYPNPTDSKIKIEGLVEAAETLIQVFNGIGKKVYSQTVTSTQTEIELTGFAPGVYILVVSQRNGTIDYKILKR
jgi:hypothetical protein